MAIGDEDNYNINDRNDSWGRGREGIRGEDKEC